MFINSKNPNKDYEKDKSCYTHTCWTCKDEFHGHKYRRVCKECLTKQNSNMSKQGYQVLKIGDYMKLTRRKALLSVSELSDKCGISEPTIRKIERGDQNIDLQKLAKVCDVLDKEIKLSIIRKKKN